MFTANSKYWVAISGAAGHCGKKIIAKYGTRQVELTVMDECPGCAHDNHLDMSIEALVELTGSAENACAINRLPVDIQWQFAGARSGRIAARVASKEMALPKVESQSIGVTPLLKPKEQPAAVIATVLAATSTLPIPKASQTSAPVQSYDQLNGTMGETAAAALISGSQRFGPTLVCIGSMLVLTTLIV